MGKILVILGALAALAFFLSSRSRRREGRALTGIALCLPFLICLFAIFILRF